MHCYWVCDMKCKIKLNIDNKLEKKIEYYPTNIVTIFGMELKWAQCLEFFKKIYIKVLQT